VKGKGQFVGLFELCESGQIVWLVFVISKKMSDFVVLNQTYGSGLFDYSIVHLVMPDLIRYLTLNP